MTQILSAAYRGMLFHASDRLLSRVDNLRPVDNRSNKALFVHTASDVALVGYTGAAYLRTPSGKEVPTDEWIAGAVTSAETKWHRPSPANDLSRQDFGRIRTRLEHHLQVLLDRTPSAHRGGLSLMIQFSGFRLNRRTRRGESFASVVHTSGGSAVRHEHHRTFALSLRAPAIVATPGLDDRAWELIHDELRQQRHSPDAMAKGFAKCIRDVAQSRPGVGRDTIVLLYSGPTGELWVDFTRDDGRYEVVLGEADVEIPVVYTPWIISPGEVIRPRMASAMSLERPGMLPRQFHSLAPEGEVPTFVFVEHERLRTMSDGRRRLPPGTQVRKTHLPAGQHTLELQLRPHGGDGRSR